MAVLRKLRRVENELGKVRTENKLLDETSENMILSGVRKKKVQSKSCDKILESVEPEIAGLAIKVSKSIGGCFARELRKLARNCNKNVCEW